MKKPELRVQFEEEAELRDDFRRWLDEDRLTDARQVRSLPAILTNPDAKAALEKDGFDAANRVLVSNDPSLGSDLFHAVKVATDALKAAPISEIRDLQTGNPQKLIMLRNLSRALEDLATLSGIQI